MTAQNAVGIDIGTSSVRVVVGGIGVNETTTLPMILGTGFSESRGMRFGYIVNHDETLRSIRTAIHEAEKSSGIKIKKAYIGLGGVSLEATTTTDSVVISRADSEITELDVKKVIDACENALNQTLVANKKIIHAIPIQYKIDGKEVFGRPAGMKGMKLEAKVLFIMCLEQHLNDLIKAVEECGIEVEDVMAAPLAAGLANLTKTQKVAGCVLANIGAQTVSIVVYENNIPISLKIFAIGSTDITNDIALGLKIPLEEAEQIKTGTVTTTTYSKKKLDEIIAARLSDIFELIEAHLKKIGKNGLLPAGVIITGGGGAMATIEDLAKAYLKLPSKRASVDPANTLKGPIKDSSWSVAYGLCIWGFTADEKETDRGASIKMIGKSAWNWLKQFLP